MSAAPHVSDEQIAAVLELMADEALTLKAAAERSGLQYGNVRRRIGLSEPLKALHTRAREEYAHASVQRMHEVADNEPDVARARLKVDVIKWEAARVLPKVYGDKLDLTVENKGTAKELTDDELVRIATAGSAGAAGETAGQEGPSKLH